MEFEKLKINDVRCVVRYLPKQMSWRTGGRRDHIVGIKLGGDAYHDFGYKDFHLTEGCVFFFNQRDDYDVRILENGESLSVHFTTAEPVETDSFCLTAAGNGELLRMLEKAETQSRRYGIDDCSVLSLVYGFCAELARLRGKTYAPRDGRMNEARAYMDLHFREGDCLEACVRLSGVSSRRFGELFRTNFGVTPNRYTVLKKIGLAKELLKTGSFSVSEVAEICGFCDVYYFSRVFKTETGLPPREWK